MPSLAAPSTDRDYLKARATAKCLCTCGPCALAANYEPRVADHIRNACLQTLNEGGQAQIQADTDTSGRTQYTDIGEQAMTKLFTTKEPALPMLLLILGCAGAVHAGFPGLATFAALIALALM